MPGASRVPAGDGDFGRPPADRQDSIAISTAIEAERDEARAPWPPRGPGSPGVGARRLIGWHHTAWPYYRASRAHP
jgi:hypothetical protein